MGSAIGDVLAPAIGIATSPIPIIAVILILFSKHARSNGPVFLAGWVLSLAAACTVLILIGSASDIGTSSGPSKGAAIFRIVLGALFLFMAWRQWKKRPKEGEEPHMPKWMASIEEFKSMKSFNLGVSLVALNPKNLVLTVAAAMSITQATKGSLSGAQPWIVMSIFVVIASSTVAAAVFTFLFGGKRAEQALDSWKAWLTVNNTTVMFVVLLILGAVILGKGISSL